MTGEEGYADSDGIRLHYLAAGDANRPLLIMLHGFPDHAGTWRTLLPPLAADYRCVAPDLRAYGKSDKPVGEEHYTMRKLVGDVAALLRHFRRDKTILLGHDWGGVIAQSFATHFPQHVERLILLNIPHLHGFRVALAHDPAQQRASAYAREFQKPGAEDGIDLTSLARYLTDPPHVQYLLATLRSGYVKGMLDYYRMNYPHPPYDDLDKIEPHIIRVPTLIVFGMKDPYILPVCLNENEQWFEKPLTLIKIPDAGHWVHHDAPDLVLAEIRTWLAKPA